MAVLSIITYLFSDGQSVDLLLKRNTKKNIIIRPHAANRLSVGIPKTMSEARLKSWLGQNEDVLRRVLLRCPSRELIGQMPSFIWYKGQRCALALHEYPHIAYRDSAIYVPDLPWPKQKLLLCRFLMDQAEKELLPRLEFHADALRLYPAATALSSAKTFWGVCRSRTGIRLNWRLIGAPEFVTDYVCVHELCHLEHPDHSRDFWNKVNQSTPYTLAAKQWLKQYGSELFVLG
ncbi:M48 family metallopeptidase [Neisseria weaveri]|uniref:M48 family metallopeptidase n=1 Tax=Neisseria weaveri TaxID=28091 RepID=UPI000D2FA0A2|nr:SprT family zinc-dependent metalloprotease [Neisseria weaveri]